MFDNHSIRRESLNDQVTELLRNAVLTGRFPPGSRLTEQGVAEMLGVSRAPVREALVRLEAEGLAENNGTGRRVVEVLRDDLEKLFDMRVVLEGLAVERAVNNVSDGDILVLRAKIEDLRLAYQHQDYVAYASGDIAMHELIWNWSANQYLSRTLSQLMAPISVALFSYARRGVRWAERFREHEALVAAISARDSSSAVAVMTEHLDHARHRVLARLETS